MSFRDCIDNGETEGAISKEEADAARLDYDKRYAEYRSTMSDADAAAKASRDTFDVLEYEAAERKRRVALARAVQRQRLQELEDNNLEYKSEALVRLVERDGSGQWSYSSIEGRREAIRGRAHAKLDNVLVSLKRSGVLGRERRSARELGEDMTKEIFGDVNTGNQAAKDMAQAWKEASEFLRKAFNRAGGSIPKRADWGMPQSHDVTKIRGDEDEWVAYIKDKLDWEKMLDESTGKKFSEAEHEQILAEVYKSITMEGFNKVGRDATLTNKSLARRRQDHRFLVFKTSDDWLEYQRKYGQGDTFTIMMEHVDAMSRDIAMLELLGPNPNATIRYLKTQAERIAREQDAAVGGGKTPNMNAYKRHEGRFNDMYGIYTGTALSPDNQLMATGFSGLGELLNAALLGSTSLLAILGDIGTARVASRIAGMPQSRMMANMLKTMVASNATKQEFLRAGLIAESWSAVAFGQSRYIGDILGPRMTRVISDATMNISLLSPWTQASRWAVGMEYMGVFADSAGKTFDQLPSKNQRLLSQYGIDASDWDKIRRTKLHTHKKVPFLRPVDVFDVDETVAYKYMEMIQKQVDISVPVASLESRAFLTAGARRGTVMGELVRSAGQFKNFPVTIMTNNLRQIRHLEASTLDRAGYGVEFMATATIFAGFSVQMREISKGRDPLEMFDEDGAPNMEFWGAAFLAGGGMGIFGDFLFSNRNRFDRGLAETAAGPRIPVIGDVLDLTVGNVMQAVQGEDTDIGREAVGFVERYMPGGSTFYARLAMQRIIFDNLRKMADPDAGRKFRRLESKMKRERGQKYWWRPGKSAPSRAPDIGAAGVGNLGEIAAEIRR